MEFNSAFKGLNREKLIIIIIVYSWHHINCFESSTVRIFGKFSSKSQSYAPNNKDRANCGEFLLSFVPGDCVFCLLSRKQMLKQTEL